jgi:hypothetical protein
VRYLVLLVLTVGLVACDPSDVVDVEINPGQAVQDAVDGVQQGVNGFNDAVQNFGGEGESEGEGEESENEE